MFKSYFKIALRNLSRNKAYSSINILGLSLGLACAMLIILYTTDELSYDRFHKNAPNIYHVVAEQKEHSGKIQKISNTGFFQGPRFVANIPEIKSYVRLQLAFRDFKLGTEIVNRELLQVDSNFFSVFSFPLIEGDAKTALEQPKSIVISEKTAKEFFGNTHAVGKIIEVKQRDKFEPYLVTAVARQTPQNSTVKFDMLMPLVVSESQMADNENWLNFHLNTFVLLSDKADPAVVASKMNAVFNKEAAPIMKTYAERFDFNAVFTHKIQPLTALHLAEEYPAEHGLSDASKPIYSYILSGIALFILLIACINFVNLTIARSLKRAKEIGIRKVVGGDRRQLIFQFLGESYILCTAAFLLAVLMVQLALPTFNQLSNKILSISYLLDAKLVTVYVGLFLITGLLAGFYPALVLSGFNPVRTLYSRFNLSGKNYLQKTLVVLQFGLATLLIVATIVIYKQFSYLTNKDLGYDDNNMVVIAKSRFTRPEAKLFKEELMKNPNIVGVAPKNSDGWGTNAHINNGNKISFGYETIDPSYLPLLKIPLAAGRNFSTDFPSDTLQSVLVNEAFVKEAGWKNPVGEIVDFFYNNQKYTVVGVVKNYHYRPLNEEIKPQLFIMKPGNPYGQEFIRIRPENQAASLEYIETTFKKLFPLAPYTYQFKDLENRRAYEAEAKWKQMMLFGAVLTIFISCIGLFGLSVLAAEKRTKEIGIRKVLGASVPGVATMLSKDFLKLVTIALLIAIPAGWYFANKWLTNYPYRIELSWQMFVLAGVLVIAIALTTVSFQAIRAALANPVKSLRTE